MTMVQSMTGFGAAERGGIRVEARSLNHRYHEIFIKLPSAYLSEDVPMRHALRERFARGKFDVHVSVGPESATKIKINHEAARDALESLTALQRDLALPGDVGLPTLLSVRDLFMLQEPIRNPEPLREAFALALEGLEQMRLAEGAALVKEINSRIDTMHALNAELKTLAPQAQHDARQKFHARLTELTASVAAIDAASILHEAASLAQKADVAEEVVRIDNHLEQMRAALTQGGAIGRRLDFLLMELNREANTVGSKSDNARMLDCVIELKSEIERCREQAQNIQ